MPGLFSNPLIEERLRQIEAAKIFSSKGGIERAKRLSPQQLSDIGSKAAKSRWHAEIA